MGKKGFAIPLMLVVLSLAGCISADHDRPPRVVLPDEDPCFDVVCFVGTAAYMDWLQSDPSSFFQIIPRDDDQRARTALTDDFLIMRVAAERDGVDRASIYAWDLRTGHVIPVIDERSISVVQFLVSGDRVAIMVEPTRALRDGDGPFHNDIHLFNLASGRIMELEVGDECWKRLNTFRGDTLTFTRLHCGGHEQQRVALDLSTGVIEPAEENPWGLPEDMITFDLGAADGWRYFSKRPDNHPDTSSSIKRIHEATREAEAVTASVPWRPMEVMNIPGRPDFIIKASESEGSSREEFVMVTRPPDFRFTRVDAQWPAPDDNGFMFKNRDPLYRPVPLYHWDIDTRQTTNILGPEWNVGIDYKAKNDWRLAELIPSQYDHWGHDDPLIGHYIWKNER